MSINNLPIGVFDSGVGGLTVLKELNKYLPKESFIYVGDLARLPYGNKSRSTILKYTKRICEYLITKKVKCIVIACNTASSIALNNLNLKEYGIPIIGVVKSGARTAAKSTNNKRIIVLATEATTNSKIYIEQIKSFDESIQINSLSCPLLVPLAEEGWIKDTITQNIIKRYLSPIFEHNSTDNIPDCLVLGCTHFPILIDDFKSILPKNIKIVCSAEATAKDVLTTLSDMQICNDSVNKPFNTLIVTDNKNRFIKIAKNFIKKDFQYNEIELVDFNM